MSYSRKAYQDLPVPEDMVELDRRHQAEFPVK